MIAGILTMACGAPEPDPPAPAAPPERALWFGGDVFVGALGATTGAERRGGVEDIAAIVGGAAGIVNLEGAVVEGPGAARMEGEGVWLANPGAAPAWLRAQGIAAVSVANNHARDPGPDAPAATVARLRESGVTPFGGPAGTAQLDVRGLDVRLVAHEAEEPGLVETLAGELRGAAISVVSLHVTGTTSYLPSPALTRVVDAAVASGADIVVAHGTHAVGPVERRATPTGETVIAWGLGNLLFDCACTDKAEAIVLRVALGVEGPGVAEVIPVTAGLGGRPATLVADPSGLFDLLDALGGTRLTRRGDRGSF